MTGHAPYIHAVASYLHAAGYRVLSTTTSDGGRPRTGRIVLARQDGWRDRRWYGGDTADVLWHEVLGWRLSRAGAEVRLHTPWLAAPGAVATTIGHWVGQRPLSVVGAVLDDSYAKPETPEFDAGLAAYVSSARVNNVVTQHTYRKIL